jgi:hypothetical protein
MQTTWRSTLLWLAIFASPRRKSMTRFFSILPHRRKTLCGEETSRRSNVDPCVASTASSLLLIPERGHVRPGVRFTFL